jgi:hypothetical protein
MVMASNLKREVSSNLLGQRIVGIWSSAPEDVPEQSFSTPLVVIELENGMHLHAQSDDEFNDAGVMVLSETKKERRHKGEDGWQENERVESTYLNYERSI